MRVQQILSRFQFDEFPFHDRYICLYNILWEYSRNDSSWSGFAAVDKIMGLYLSFSSFT